MTTKNYNKLEDKNTLYNLKSTTDGFTVVKSHKWVCKLGESK